MKWHPEDERRWAVARFNAGDPVATEAAAPPRRRIGIREQGRGTVYRKPRRVRIRRAQGWSGARPLRVWHGVPGIPEGQKLGKQKLRTSPRNTRLNGRGRLSDGE
jgi:hypothetical protein